MICPVGRGSCRIVLICRSFEDVSGGDGGICTAPYKRSEFPLRAFALARILRVHRMKVHCNNRRPVL